MVFGLQRALSLMGVWVGYASAFCAMTAGNATAFALTARDLRVTALQPA